MATIQTDTVVSIDGTQIEYNFIGQGPGILIISGGSRAAWHYLKLAEFLASGYTVYLINRRGRGNSGPQGIDYNIQKECEDAISIIKKHEIPYIFGHSFGGVVALNVALNYRIKKIAVFEPAVSGSSNLPTSWLPKFEKQLQYEDHIGAMITMIKGLQVASFLKYIPNPLLKMVFKKMAPKNPTWEKDKMLLEMLPNEVIAVVPIDNDTSRYNIINCPVLLLGGSKSPKFLQNGLNKLHGIIPSSSIHVMKGMEHNTPDDTEPELTAKALKEFFN